MSLIVRARRPLVSDLALAAVVLVMELPDALSSPTPKTLFVSLGAVVVIGLSRRAPVAATVLIGGLELLGRQGPDVDAPVSAVLLVLYQVGRYASVPWAAGTAAAALAVSFWIAREAVLHDFLLWTAVATAPALPVAAGYIVRLRGELTPAGSSRRPSRPYARSGGASPANCTT
ncbi:hypothetical protein [Nonomuraea longicatena]|uniref:Rod shape-determining protein MreD n=1 Tax=Nonomuraea longicatena TaxID=83682 RepID=A0ABP3ZFY0_9ACTN